MASEFTTKVRLVRCPKCRLVLPELPDFNVYKCGACGATLQAKNPVNNARSTGSGSNDVDVVHEEKEEAGSSNKAVLTDSGECFSSQNNDQMRSKEFNPSSDQFSGSLGDLSKSPTRSSHAYDASISSYDGIMDDQFLQRHLHSLENAYKAANFLHSEELPRREKLPARMMMNRDSEMQHQARPSWSDKKNRYMKDSQWDRDERGSKFPIFECTLSLKCL